MFTGTETTAVTKTREIIILNSTPYYAQDNEQAELTNKILKGIIENMINENLRKWDKLLSEALWAYRTSKRSSTGVTLFMLTYGHDVMLPMEVTVRSVRRALQN